MKRHPNLAEAVKQRSSFRCGRSPDRATRRLMMRRQGDLRSWGRRGRETRAELARRGSTLLVVMALLGMLTLLGMLYFTFSTQEQQSATNFAEAIKQIPDPGDDIDAIFDEILTQVIQGPSYDKRQSALWGGRQSLAFTMLGHDLQPFNGAGVKVYRDSSGTLVVDQDRDGVADADQSFLELNDSPAVRDGFVAQPRYFERRVETFPAPDVDYTYADNNNAFLAYIGTTWKTPAGVAPTGYALIKPSFHRPEFLRDNNGDPVTDWDTNSGARGRLFRPHPDHLYVPKPGQSITTAIRRFLNSYDAADSADINSLSTVPANRGFPFTIEPATGTLPLMGALTHRRQGVWSLTGLPPNPPFTFPSYDFDVDNDLDGTNDSIWMDLDLPVLVRPSDNKTYIPLVALLIQDLDSLLNLNAIGNLSGDTRNNNTTNFGNSADIHASAQGLGPSEINPLWALDTLPSETASLTDHQAYFRAAGGPPITSSRELANMEWWLFNKGRVQFTTPRQIHAGRYGEADRIWGVLNQAGGGPVIAVQNSANSNLFPFAGIWDSDDNQNANEGGRIAQGVAGQALPFGHPLAINGMGRFWTAGSPKVLNLFAALGPGDPSRWLRYDGMGLGYDGNAAAGNVVWLNPFSGALMINSLPGANFAVPGGMSPILWDDPDELTLHRQYLQRPYDEPLEDKDILWLTMGSSDRTKTGLTSRLQDLMPANMTPNSAANFYQLDVAKRFTTQSWDVKQFALPRFIGGPGADGAPGVAGKDDNRDGVNDDLNERGWPGSDDDRAWEYNVDLDANGWLEFPPQFNPAGDFQPRLDSSATDYRPENAYGNNNIYLPSLQPHVEDPFRPQLRRLLSIEFGNTSVSHTPMRLSLNEFLDVEHQQRRTANPYTDRLAYRALTPHSSDSTLSSIPSLLGGDNQPGIAGVDDNNNGLTDDIAELGAAGSDDPNFPPSSEGEKEFWARRDRQQMARDIYVLLYTFCGGNDSANVTTVAGDMIYPTTNSLNVRRQMAQFAVNFVDALDRDNVMTEFEYDENLADGWNLDDDPATTDTMPASSNRSIVFGVETQQLTFSEALWLQQAQIGTNNSYTPYDDSAGDNNFLHIELRSTSALNSEDANGNGALDAGEDMNANSTLDTGTVLAASNSTTVNTGLWRIIRDDNGNGVLDAANANNTETAVTLLTGAGTMAPGALYCIAAADASPVGSAAFYADYTGANTDFELVSPNTGAPPFAGSPPGVPVPNLDMQHSAHAARFTVQGGGQGDFLSRNNFPKQDTDGTTLQQTNLSLQRRLNPSLPLLSLAANPYATVDTMRNVRRRDLKFEGDGSLTPAAPAVSSQAGALNRLSMTAPYDAPSLRLNSQERYQPLDGANVPNSGGMAPSPLPNTLKQVNQQKPAFYFLFQPHFDRDFASVVELFDIPLEGPNVLTRMIVNSRRPPNLVADVNGDGTDDPVGQLENGGPVTFGAAVLMQSEDRDGDSNLDVHEDAMTGDVDGDGNTDRTEDFNNNGQLDAHPYHFHRLLSLVEVPTRSHRQLGDPLKMNYVAGKINLNGVRDSRVLAGAIDERQVMGPPERRDAMGNEVGDGDGSVEPGLQDLLGDVVEDSNGNPIQRDWWFQFLVARDGLDPTTGLPLPISGYSRPFRDLGYLRYDDEFGVQSSIEDTILRELPGGVKYTRNQGGKGKGKGKAKGKQGGGTGSAGTSDGRRLFELATEGEFTGNPATTASLEPMMRHRLLSKLIGNTTTRSNVFVVQATIGMFACKEYANGSVRIGGQMDVDGDGSPDTHRAIIVIDRASIAEAYDKGSGTFDWKKLVTARQRIN